MHPDQHKAKQEAEMAPQLAPSEYYDSAHSEIALTWSKYFHYGIFDNDTQSHEAAQERTLDIIAHEANLTSDTKLLDLGCGIGSSSFHLASKYGARVIGIDPSSEQVAYAKEIAIHKNLPNIDFMCASAEALPLPSSTFDLVLANEVFCHIADKPKALAEIRRVLKQECLCILTDLFQPKPDESTEPFHRELRHSLPMLSLEHYEELFRASGLGQTKLVDYSVQLERNYQAAIERVKANKDAILSHFGQRAFLENLSFYELALNLVASQKIGWFLCVLQND